MDSVEQQRKDILEFVGKTGVRATWHEPDEQGVDAYFSGKSFDNAMGTSEAGREMLVHVLQYGGPAELVINLANLLADYARLVRKEVRLNTEELTKAVETLSRMINEELL